MKKKVILIRLDKIGDLICTLPVDQIFPKDKFEITWIVQKGMGAVIELSGTLGRHYFEIDKNSPREASAQVLQIVRGLQPDIAISFQAPWWVNLRLLQARIPLRIGVLSQWHSFIFLNHGVRQKRSQSKQHEFDYNLDLVKMALQKVSPKLSESIDVDPNDLQFNIPFSDQSRIAAEALLNLLELKPKSYFVIHPGMMGSALNWPAENYIELIRLLLTKNPDKKIVLTGTASDEAYLRPIKSEFSQNPLVVNLQSKLTLSQLTHVLFLSQAVVAPSTGVAHLAASVGATLKAIYSPIQVHHPRRWGPRGKSVEVFLPKVDCPAVHQCLGESCPYFNCMDLISPENFLRSLQLLS